MNVDQRSTKAEIIEAACELADWQADRISQLEQRQTVLLVACGLLAVLWLLW